MTKQKQEKLVRFVADEVMAEAVFDVLLNAFTKGSVANDVQWLAAERLAIDLLKDAWKRDILAFKPEVEHDQKGNRNVGL